MNSVTDEQLSAFERRMREKEKREHEDAAEEIANTAALSLKVVHGAEGEPHFEVTCPEFPGLVAHRESKESAERSLRQQIRELVLGRLSRGSDPWTGEDA